MSSYDQNLLGEAPRATRAQMQEGYNIDLLEQPPRRTPSVRVSAPPPPPVSAVVPLTPGIAENGSGEKFGAQAYTSPTAAAKRQSFWRTRNGIITIILIAIIIVGAVVGGAVGGTVGKKSNSGKFSTGSASDTTSSSPISIPIPISSLPFATHSSSSSSPSTAPVVTQGVGGASPSSAAAESFGHIIPSATPSGQNIQMVAANANEKLYSH